MNAVIRLVIRDLPSNFFGYFLRRSSKYLAFLLENECIAGFHTFEPLNIRLLSLELRSPKASKPVGLVETVIPDGE